ncbi:MAG: hypothetical protein AAGI68_02320 [Planctomycetota bacterium]
MNEAPPIEAPGLWLRLGLALALTLVAYAIAVPQAAGVLADRTTPGRAGADSPTATPTPDDAGDESVIDDGFDLGRLDAPPVQTIAFIGHEDFERLVARQSVVTQAALQDAADPTPDAPDDVLDPTPPQAASPPTPPAVPTSPTTPPTPSTPTAPPALRPQPVTPAPLIAEGTPPLTGDLAVSPPPPPSPTPPTPEPPDPAATPSPPTPDQPAPPAPASPAAEPVPDTQDPTPEDPRPTSAPRTDAESPPVTVRFTDLERQANGVFVGQGLELVTKRPEWVNSAIFAAPRVAVFNIRFNTEGRVDRVTMLQSTDYADIDDAIVNSVYRYRLRGETLDESGGVTIQEFGIRYRR